MKPIIKVENLSKQYRLGNIGTGTVRDDFQRWLHRIQGKDDPFLKIGETNDRSSKGSSDYVWALKDINFEVMPGEVLGIIGKNGAGKSTLLKILSKVTGPTTGRIDYNGRIGSLLEVGTGFHPELTGRENIFLNGAILGMTKREIRAKLDEIIDFSGCERYIDTPVKRYSSGMTVRLGFAVAAHLDPEILIVDEVLAVGDAEFQKKAIGKMQDVSRNEGRTVLFVSHNLGAVRNLCTKSVVLFDGKCIFSGIVEESINIYMENRVLHKTIIGNIKYKSNKIVINSILANNSPEHIVNITDKVSEIEIFVEGRVLLDAKMSLEMIIFDSNDIPLATFSPMHTKGKLREYKKGQFVIQETLKIPKGVNSGKYYADIYITNPMVESYIEIEKCLTISVEGNMTKSGYILEYSKGYGWVLIG